MSQIVETYPLADDLRVTRVVTGLWQIADLEREGAYDLEAASVAMDSYVQAGLTTFDMADHYGSAELIAGAYRQQQPQNSLRYLTKWVPEPGPVSPDMVRAAVERALTRLQTNRLDLLQFHTWRYCDPSWLDALYYLQELKAEGLIAHLGVTNFDAAHLDMAIRSGIDIRSNQVSYSLLDQRASGELTRVCLEHGISILAYGTIAGGFLSERWLAKADPGLAGLATWSQMKYYRFIQSAGGWDVFQTVLAALQQVSARHQVSMATVAARLILQQPAVAAVIIGARLAQSEHIADTLQLFALKLSSDDTAMLTEALQGLTMIPGDCGDEYRRPPFLTASGDLSHHLATFPPVYPVLEREGRQLVLSGTEWETLAGYSRAVRQGERILVSGTTATHGSRLMGGQNAAAQAHFIIDKLEAAITSLGGRLEDVVRTRIYVRNMADWEAVSRVHGQRFGHIQPANTLIQANLVGEGYLVEMEAEATINT